MVHMNWSAFKAYGLAVDVRIREQSIPLIMKQCKTLVDVMHLYGTYSTAFFDFLELFLFLNTDCSFCV